LGGDAETACARGSCCPATSTRHARSLGRLRTSVRRDRPLVRPRNGERTTRRPLMAPLLVAYDFASPTPTPRATHSSLLPPGSSNPRNVSRRARVVPCRRAAISSSTPLYSTQPPAPSTDHPAMSRTSRSSSLRTVGPDSGGERPLRPVKHRADSVATCVPSLNPSAG
jgi:hypothetical protein